MKSIHLQKYVGQRIRIIRKEKNLSQQNLSEKAGVGIDYISNLETKGSNIKIDKLEKIITAQTSQEQLLEAFQLLIKTVKEKPNR